jgi:ribonuclease HI
MNKEELTKLLTMFIPETELFMEIDGRKLPINSVAADEKDGTGIVVLKPDYKKEATPTEAPSRYGKRLTLWADGACSGNPGPGGWAYVLCDGSSIIHKGAGHLELSTNNKMELIAVIQGLSAAIRHKGVINKQSITIVSDSEYVINGANGKWVTKTNLKEWSDLERTLGNLVGWEITWIREKVSNACHRWCDQAATTAAKNNGDIGKLADAHITVPAHIPSFD